MKAVLIFCFQSPIFWMFIEGIYLHSRVSTNIFNHAPPFSIYYFIGWGKAFAVISQSIARLFDGLIYQIIIDGSINM